MTPPLVQTDAPPSSLLVEPDQHALLPPKTAATLGSTIAIAPHPDDESLGCGGLLALLAAFGNAAHVLVMTDGSRSHPNSPSYPAARLAALREQETLAALEVLGLPASTARFLRYPDCGLPAAGTVAFGEAATQLREMLVARTPDTLLVPWRRDPHCDHEATWRLLREASAGMPSPPRWLEYPIWAWTQAESKAAPQTNDGHAWRLDISPVLARKERAIARHRSQMGVVIQDDPGGFVLEPAMLAHFARPWELFIEPVDG
ncbi:MAG: PIG-L family deacetylase [Verrucomicrobiota bacterium]|nr:PIG-L family deacetylase [Verrucomicrobiota bacterium]